MDVSKVKTSLTAPFLIMVIPCYNEQEVIVDSMSVIADMLEELKKNGKIHPDSCACYIDDGSRDATWKLLQDRHATDRYCRVVKLAGNAGHQNAVWAGMMKSTDWGADCIISMDADLQDDIHVLPQMLEQYGEGCEIVYGVRQGRQADTVFKKTTAHIFYALMSYLNVSIIPDHADYRLVSRRVLEALKGFDEYNLFLRGLFPRMGFKTGKVYYARKPRQAGESKYPLKKMIAFAWEGITSCSATPLRIAGFMSLLCMFVALIIFGISIYKYMTSETVPGWTSLIAVTLFIGAVQLFCLAVIGEYLGKIFNEVRHRPRYIIEKILE